MVSPFSSSDAWVLQSIHQAGKGASLRDLVAVGDYLNHAVIMYTELSGAYQRLSVAGLVFFSDGVFETTPVFVAWWKDKFGKKKSVSVSKEYEEIVKWLAGISVKDWEQCLVPFKEAEYDAVVRAYISTIRTGSGR